MVELFTRKNDSYFAQTLGIPALKAHFNKLEKELRNSIATGGADLSDHMTETQTIMRHDAIFRHLAVQRSRAYARESQIRESKSTAVFPTRKDPQVAAYSIRKTYGRLLEMFEKAFQKEKPLFTLPMYYPLKWYKGSDDTIDPFMQGRQEQIVRLIRTSFLKRFESSVVAFESSCERLMKKLMAFIEVHADTDSEKRIYERWKNQNAEILHFETQRRLDLWGSSEEEEEDEDIVPQELLADVVKLNRDEYKVDEMISETYLDLDQIVRFLNELRSFEATHDDKVKKLIQILKSKELSGKKVLIFTEFADTARYLKQQLETARIDGVAQVDSGTKRNRAEVIRCFSPYYNGSTPTELKKEGLDEIRILVATDVLSEGLNLQDASYMINYDIHWNPVRLMQRIGRVDRRMSPDIEAAMIADNPALKNERGTVGFWNFLPPDELNKILSLFKRVTDKTLVISKTFGIEGRKLLKPEDDYAAIQEFNHAYEGTKSAVEEMHLEYQAVIQQFPELEGQLNALPGSVYSGKKQIAAHARGVFFCYALPALDNKATPPVFSIEAGTTRWYLYDAGREAILTESAEIVESIRAEVDTPRVTKSEQSDLVSIRKKVEKHIKDTYMKRVDAPVGVNPVLRCWIELC
jgi:hypothetical protein